jgi:hypothetical protein
VPVHPATKPTFALSRWIAENVNAGLSSGGRLDADGDAVAVVDGVVLEGVVGDDATGDGAHPTTASRDRIATSCFMA